MELHLNDRVELKKQHTCGCKTFVITRMLPRSKAEKSIRKILSGGDAS